MVKFFKDLKRSTIIFFILFFMFSAAGLSYVKTLCDADVIKKAIQVDNGTVQSENEGKEILASGKLKINEYPKDDETGISVKGYALIKTVGVYQYAISDDGEIIEDYYSYQLANVEGKDGTNYKNPIFPADLRNETILANVTFSEGNLVLGSDYVASILSDYEYIDVTASYVDNLPEIENEYGLSPVTYDGYTAYYSGNPESPKTGDIRVAYEYIPESELSELTAFGVQKDGELTAGREAYASMAEGVMSAKDLYETVTDEASFSLFGFEFIAFVFLALTVFSYLRGKGKLQFKSVKSLSLILIAVILLGIPTVGKADFGDYGGDNDYGGYDSYDSYDYDYGDNDYDYGDSDSGGGFIFFFDDDDETTSADYSYVDYPCSEDAVYSGDIIYCNPSGNVIDDVNVLTVISPSDENYGKFVQNLWISCITLIIVVFILKRKKNGGGGTPRPAGAARTDASTLTDINQYNNIDENFSLTDFKDNISDLYIKLQNSWQEKNIEDLRPYLTDSFYAQCERQLNNYFRNKQTNIIRDITVENVDVKGFKQDEENDYIILELTAKIKDYVIDDNTGNVIRGNSNSFKRMQYEWTVLRAKGKITGASITENAVCPHCGAPLTLNAASRCEYCDSLITSEASDWALKEIRGLSQTTLN